MAFADIYINSSDQFAGVTLDAGWRLNRLCNPSTAYGSAFATTLEELGIEAQAELTGCEPRLKLTGSVEVVQQRAASVAGRSAVIAELSATKELAFQRYNRDTIAGIVYKLAATTLPELSADTPLDRLSFMIAAPFARQTQPNSLLGHIGRCLAPWQAGSAERELQVRLQNMTGQVQCIPTTSVVPAEMVIDLLDNVPAADCWPNGAVRRIFETQTELAATHAVVQ